MGRTNLFKDKSVWHLAANPRNRPLVKCKLRSDGIFRNVVKRAAGWLRRRPLVGVGVVCLCARLPIMTLVAGEQRAVS